MRHLSHFGKNKFDFPRVMPLHNPRTGILWERDWCRFYVNMLTIFIPRFDFVPVSCKQGLIQPRTQDLSLGKTLAGAGHVPHQKCSARGGVGKVSNYINAFPVGYSLIT